MGPTQEQEILGVLVRHGETFTLGHLLLIQKGYTWCPGRIHLNSSITLKCLRLRNEASLNLPLKKNGHTSFFFFLQE